MSLSSAGVILIVVGVSFSAEMVLCTVEIYTIALVQLSSQKERDH
jgi:hypothetical protein